MILPTGNKRIKRSKAPLRAGFTLIELILVMAILLIVIAVSAPSLSNFFRGRTLDSEGRQFISLTRLGQSRAVSEGVPMQLWIDVEQRAYGLQADSSYLDTDTKTMQFMLGQDLNMEVVAAAKAKYSAIASRAKLPMIRFQPDGSISSDSPDQVIFQHSNGSLLFVGPNRARLSYEIQTNNIQTARR